MAKFWNFVFFQLGWFACILGAANQQALWAVLVTLAYIACYIWFVGNPKQTLGLLTKVWVFGVVADSLLVQLGYLSFQDSWPTNQLSPMWMWVLWVLLATTIDSSLSWLRGKAVLGAVLGSICGPLSYEAGIRMGAGSWGSGSQMIGLILVGAVWTVAIPLFFYWDRSSGEHGLAGNP